MKITKVKKVTTSSESSSPKSLVIVYDNGVQFSFFETDEDKEKNEGEWSAIQAWVADGNSLEVVD